MVGTSGGELGIRGYIAAFDAADGTPPGRRNTVPGPGEPARYLARRTWKTGGVSVWLTAHYDPQLSLSFWGRATARVDGRHAPGDNLYSSSVLALDVDTADPRLSPVPLERLMGLGRVSTPLLIDFPKDGAR